MPPGSNKVTPAHIHAGRLKLRWLHGLTPDELNPLGGHSKSALFNMLMIAYERGFEAGEDSFTTPDIED